MLKDSVVHVIVPRFNPNAVVWCRMQKVLCKVVYNNCALQRSAEEAKVLSIEIRVKKLHSIVLVRCGVLTIESVLDYSKAVDIIHDPVSIL